MKITEAQRKTLTEELLKECWHEWVDYGYTDFDICKECGEIERFSNHKNNRTFDNWTDFGVVVEKLRAIFMERYLSKITLGTEIKELPERFCILVAEAIKEGVIK